jgi:5-methyltetrahydrofolate--homocysteine methyltransferase
MADLQGIKENLINGRAEEVERLVKEALDEKFPVEKILKEALIAGMDVVGDNFKNNVFYVPEVLIAARAMNTAMALLTPLLAESGVEPVGRAVIGTVKGDLHDIGKNLVGMMLKGGGFEVYDLGIDVSPEKFIEAAKEKNCQLICLSALLTTTMPQMENVVKAVRASGLADKKVLIGGAPVTQSYADEISADGYAPDAASAVDMARKLVGKG